MDDFGLVSDGITPNDSIVATTISSISGNGAVLVFPTGNFLFNSTISLPSNIVIKVQGAENTQLIMYLSVSGNAFEFTGSVVCLDTTTIINQANNDSTFLIILQFLLPTIGFELSNTMQI